MTDQPPQEVPQLIRNAFAGYLSRRMAYYAAPKTVLRGLLKKNGLVYALRGVETADEFAEQAFYAHEASSGETMLGNAWQAGLAAISPNSVGGGDLRTERDGTLWIIQVKTSRGQNAGAEAQDLRMLKTKLVAETDHHPGRRNVKAMLGFVRGPAADDWRTYRSQSRANADIDTFQYHYMAGTTFLKWCSADFDHQKLLADLGVEIKQVRAARRTCLAEVQGLLREQLLRHSMAPTMESVLRLMEPTTPKAT